LLGQHLTAVLCALVATLGADFPSRFEIHSFALLFHGSIYATITAVRLPSPMEILHSLRSTPINSASSLRCWPLGLSAGLL